MPDSWRENLIETEAGATDLLRRAKRIAVLGIKTEARSSQPAFYVPEYLQRVGYDIIPVPVYYPEVERILGKKVYRRISDIPEPVDIVVVFRRSGDIPPHLDDIIAARPGAVWFQSGIRNDEAARRLAEEGIPVVQSRCTMYLHRLMS